MKLRWTSWCGALTALCAMSAGGQDVHHYVFFGRDRERIRDTHSFLETRQFEGAQIAYTWRELEPEKDKYDFSSIREDLAFLNARRKKLFVQFQDVSFSPTRKNVPEYLLRDPQYNGGAAPQYPNGEDENPPVAGWVARRWDPAVQDRLSKLFTALGNEFDGRIEGINLAETSLVFRPKLQPAGFSFAGYQQAVIVNMTALKRAFPRSVAMVYANFMPGEWRATNDKGYLRGVYDAAKKLNVAVGGPDLLPYRPAQLQTSYPLIREAAQTVLVGIAVQDGDYADPNPATGLPMSVEHLIAFAMDSLHVDYIFWCTEEPYYSRDLVPFIRARGR